MWRGCLNPKEYYTRFIKVANRDDFLRTKEKQEKALSIIHRFDSVENEPEKIYEKNVDKYMRLLSTQDGTQLPPVKQASTEREEVNKASFIRVKELITTNSKERSPIKALEQPKPFRLKAVPRYMQAN